MCHTGLQHALMRGLACVRELHLLPASSPPISDLQVGHCQVFRCWTQGAQNGLKDGAVIRSQESQGKAPPSQLQWLMWTEPTMWVRRPACCCGACAPSCGVHTWPWIEPCLPCSLSPFHTHMQAVACTCPAWNGVKGVEVTPASLEHCRGCARLTTFLPVCNGDVLAHAAGTWIMHLYLAAYLALWMMSLLSAGHPQGTC